MMQQYEEIKSRHRDSILLFRLGDFYEMFGRDAQEGSRILGLTLTQRQDIPMCGVPHHASRAYIHRLLRAGRKVAVCEQTSDPSGKHLTDREVVEVLSPGAVFDLDYLDPRSANYIAAVGVHASHVAVAWADASTGELSITAYPISRSDRGPEEIDACIRAHLARWSPQELIVQESLIESSAALRRLVESESPVVVNRLPDWGFDLEHSHRRITELLRVGSLRGFGIDSSDPAVYPVAALLEYLEDNARRVLSHIRSITRHRDEDTLHLDEATIRNLELIANMRDGSAAFSLIGVLDRCRTSMGSRLLRRRILAPARAPEVIEERLERVEALYRDQRLLNKVRTSLGSVHDLERLIGRLGVGKAHPKDLVGIAATLGAADVVANLLPGHAVFQDADHQTSIRALRERISRTLEDEPPAVLNEGGIIRPGFDAELDRLRTLRDQSREILEGYLEEQRAETGIASLKIKYNRVLGHFFEVPSSHASKLPERFIRRQSLANAERFSTVRLAELQDAIINSREQSDEREYALFLELRNEAAAHADQLAAVATRLADIDVVADFAYVATERGYRRPSLTMEPVVDIGGGRHPVVEYHQRAGEFVDNTVVLDADPVRFALITGPNMAGKSTVLRQTALIAIMAHVGSFVPAEEALIGVCDRLFCRVGASDNIARGESTFLVEMNETSNILRNATDRSLVIMDEVGRGTSTHDGLAIAWAVSEHLLNRARCRTLFATHYHELARLKHPAFRAFGMAVDHSGGEIVFLKKLTEDPDNRSYGVDVARLAGLPEPVIARAREILTGLENGSTPSVVASEPHSPNRTGAAASAGELFSHGDLLAAELSAVDPDQLSPREALDLLYRWKSRVASED